LAAAAKVISELIQEKARLAPGLDFCALDERPLRGSLGCVSRARRSAISAFTRVFDSHCAAPQTGTQLAEEPWTPDQDT
jgi:hypothetical protein